MSTELTYLIYTVLLTGLLWIPYILNRVIVGGLVAALSYPTNPAQLSSWSQRLKASHYNAVENLVLFAPVVIAIEISEIGSDATSTLTMVYFYSRLVHVISYTFAIPFVRTAAFAVGFTSLLGLIWNLLVV